MGSLHIGCAGWAIPKQDAGPFPAIASHLERYAERLNAVEINSTFYKSHKTATYARWATAVPDNFRVAVKMPKEITHVHRLADGEGIKRFLAEVAGLGAKLGPLVLQLPPSLAFDANIVGKFFKEFCRCTDGSIVSEPRHASWFADEADKLLAEFRIARVATDPVVVPRAAQPGGWHQLAYYRLHGSPRMYYSAYSEEFLDDLAKRIAKLAPSSETWCIFDNTASRAATGNALALLDRLSMK